MPFPARLALVLLAALALPAALLLGEGPDADAAGSAWTTPGFLPRVAIFGLGFASLGYASLGMAGLRRGRLAESRAWTAAAAASGFAALLAGLASGLGWIASECGSLAGGAAPPEPRALASALHEGAERGLLGVGSGAAGLLGAGLLSLLRRRAEHKRGPVSSEDPALLAESQP